MSNTNTDILKGSNVKIDQLSKFISQSGVMVHPHIGRLRKKVALPKELLGNVNSVDKKDDDEFYSEYITQGTINLIPKSDEKKLISIETSVRGQVSKLAIACDGTFMTSDVYINEYLPYFNKKKTEYLEKRDEIVAKWNILIDIFKTKLELFLDRRNIPNKQAIMNSVIANIPTKSDFANSFYMDVTLTAFPVEENVDMFSSAVADQVRRSITDTKLVVVKEMLGTLLGDTFTKINDLLVYYRDNGEIKKQQMKPMRELKKNLIKNNILKHELIQNIVEEFTVLEKVDVEDCDALAEQMERILVMAYGFLKDTGLDEYMKVSDYAINEFDMARMYIGINPNSAVVQEILEAMDTNISA